MSFTSLHLKDGDIKECCIAQPDIKGVTDPDKLENFEVVGKIRLCTEKGTSETHELEVEVKAKECLWCFIVDTTELDGPGKYEIEFVATWDEDDGPRVCHLPANGFLLAEVQESTSTS